MARKYFLIIDTETTQTGKVVDFGAVVCDRQGNVVNSCGVLIRELFNSPDTDPLFFTADANPLWGRANLPARYAAYQRQLENGSRMLASVPAVNRWLAKVAAQYRPILTAYNLAFDAGKMSATDIDHGLFDKRFCLWHAAAAKWGHTKKFRQFVLDTVSFNAPTKLGNMSYLTNAEIMARFVLGDPSLPDEPHTALEDAMDYERPILAALVKNTPPSEYMNPPVYDWRQYQVKDWFAAK